MGPDRPSLRFCQEAKQLSPSQKIAESERYQTPLRDTFRLHCLPPCRETITRVFQEMDALQPRRSFVLVLVD